MERYVKIVETCWNHVETCRNVLKLPISCVEIRSAAGPPFSHLRIRSTVSLNLSWRNGQGMRRRNVGNSLLQWIKFMFSIASTWGDPRQNQPRTGSTAQRIQIKDVTMIQPKSGNLWGPCDNHLFYESLSAQRCPRFTSSHLQAHGDPRFSSRKNAGPKVKHFCFFKSLCNVSGTLRYDVKPLKTIQTSKSCFHPGWPSCLLNALKVCCMSNFS